MSGFTEEDVERGARALHKRLSNVTCMEDADDPKWRERAQTVLDAVEAVPPSRVRELEERCEKAVEMSNRHAARLAEEGLRTLALEAREARLRTALERIASLKPRPVLDPHNCEERLKRIAREALSGGE